jgi:hypothetical protein
MVTLQRYGCRVHKFGSQILFCITGKAWNTCVANTDLFLWSADEKFNSPTETNVVVQHTGDIIYSSPRILKSICPFSTTSVSFVSVSYCKKSLIHVSFYREYFYFIGYVFLQFEIWVMDIGHFWYVFEHALLYFLQDKWEKENSWKNPNNVKCHCDIDYFRPYLVFITDFLHSVRDYYLGINLTITSKEIDLSSYTKNSEWDLIGKPYEFRIAN